MRILIICCLFLLACNSDTKKPGEENKTVNSSNDATDVSNKQKQAEDKIREYAAMHSKGKPGDFDFKELKKNTGQYADEVYSIKCAFKETYEDGANPMDMKQVFFLDKDLNVIRVEYNW